MSGYATVMTLQRYPKLITKGVGTTFPHCPISGCELSPGRECDVGQRNSSAESNASRGIQLIAANTPAGEGIEC